MDLSHASPIHPEVTVQLGGLDGNAFSILGRAKVAIRAAGIGTEDQQAFVAEATEGDYDHLLRTVNRWFDTA